MKKKMDIKTIAKILLCVAFVIFVICLFTIKDTHRNYMDGIFTVKKLKNTTLDFDTTDINGARVDFKTLCKDASLIMINYWEPWCGPCLEEMPDLEQIYRDYKDEGLLIIGVYFNDDPETVKRAAEEKGVTYPLIKGDDKLLEFTSDYVPTSVFFAGDGSNLSEQFIGARKYADWKTIVKDYLKY